MNAPNKLRRNPQSLTKLLSPPKRMKIIPNKTYPSPNGTRQVGIASLDGAMGSQLGPSFLLFWLLPNKLAKPKEPQIRKGRKIERDCWLKLAITLGTLI